MFSVLVTKVPRTGLQPKRAHSAHVEASWGFRLKDPCGAWAAQGRPAAPGRSELAPQASTSASRCFRHGPTTLGNAQDGPRPPRPKSAPGEFLGELPETKSPDVRWLSGVSGMLRIRPEDTQAVPSTCPPNNLEEAAQGHQWPGTSKKKLEGTPTTKTHRLSEHSLGDHPEDVGKHPRVLRHTTQTPKG